MLRRMMMAGVTGGGGISFANVRLLLHGDGANGATSIVDSSSYARTMTVAGSAVIDTAQSVFGGSSLYIPASKNGWTTSGDSSLDMRAGAFQIDWRVRLGSGLTSDALTDSDTSIAMANSSNYSYEWGVIASKTCIQFYCGYRGTNQRWHRFFYPSGYDMSASGTWVALSIARDSSGKWGAWIDGNRCPDYQPGNFSTGISMGTRVNGGTLTDTTDFNVPASRLLNIGRFSSTEAFAQTKHVDELRYVIGECRDVFSNYTPLATPFPDS